jgi:hypothetical protein
MRRLRNPGGWWQEHASSNGGPLSSVSGLATGREEPPLAHCQRFLVDMGAAYPILPDTRLLSSQAVQSYKVLTARQSLLGRRGNCNFRRPCYWLKWILQLWVAFFTTNFTLAVNFA